MLENGRSAFYDCLSVEQRGRAILLPFLRERTHGGQLVLTNKGPLARWLQESVGDVLLNPAGEPERLVSVELKTEERHTGNLYLETWSNRNLEDEGSHGLRGSNPGWMFKLQSDKILFYFLDTDDLYAVDLLPLKRWSFGYGNQPGRMYDYPEKPQGKRVQLNDAWGRVVPVAHLREALGRPAFAHARPVHQARNETAVPRITAPGLSGVE